MHQILSSPWPFLLFITLLLAFMELGYRVGFRHKARLPGDTNKGRGALNGSVYGLLGLLIAFTFSGAANRFDGRRQLVTEETNTLRTAWQRLELLPQSHAEELRALLRRYTDLRLQAYDTNHPERFYEMMRQREQLQEQIWSKAVLACREANPPSIMGSVLPALNNLFDAATKQTAATRQHPPQIIYFVLGGLTMLGAFLAGYEMGMEQRRCWLHILLYAVAISVSQYIIIDMEHPRLGQIRVNDADQLLIEYRQIMK